VTRKNAHILREVRSDPRSFLDKPLNVEGKIELANYYNDGYRDAAPTHYSFELGTADGGFMPTWNPKGQLPFVSDWSTVVALSKAHFLS
jgi:hypothetical protein